MAGVLDLLCSKSKLERDKGVEELFKFLDVKSQEEILYVQGQLNDLLLQDHEQWETKHGALMGMKALIANSPLPCETFAPSVRDRALLLLEDNESRVRLAAGELIGVLCHKIGPTVYENCRSRIYDGICQNLERNMDVDEPSSHDAVEQLTTKLQGEKPQLKRRLSKEDIFHDTAGWKSLETWMKCLQFAIDGCGFLFNPYVDQDLLDLVFRTLDHTNRFVRETGFYVCASLVGCNFSKNGEMLVPLENNMIYHHGEQFANHVSRGLADNWSQVRMAASTAARNFLLGLPTNESRQKFFNKLLPPLCLNRYYVAEGVRNYNQETWRQVTNGNGIGLVEIFVEDVVQFYISQSQSENHAVREAACECIAELAEKINKEALSPYISSLLETLLECFKDDSWPVRDAACLACGKFVRSFPDESRCLRENLLELFHENLGDNIASVRQGAAVSLGRVVEAYGEDVLVSIATMIREGLSGMADQPADTQRYQDLDKGPATYGVVKQLRDNDMELHENNPMYSCGSLAPKMGRGNRGGGCMDHQFRKPPEKWELADGCVCLVGELSQLQVASKEVEQLQAALVQAASHRHYTQHVIFLETLCNQIPRIAKGIGKRAFKAYIESYFDPVFFALNCDNQLTRHAATECLKALSQLLGPNILRGRIENYDPRYLESLPLMNDPGYPGPSAHHTPVPAGMMNPGSFPRPFGSSYDPFAGATPPGNVTRISGQLQKPTPM